MQLYMNDQFCTACYFGHLTIAKLILQNNPDINISAQNNSAFRYACERDHLKVAEWLRTLKPFLYIINYNTDDRYSSYYIRTKDYYIRTKEEARWQKIKYLVWLSSTQSPNVNCIFYKLPNDISRYIIQNFL